MDKIMLIDGNSIINRAFYALPLLTGGDGIYTNGVYGFLNIMFKFMEDEKPRYLAVAFDLPGLTFRHERFAEYKGTRKGMPEELIGQVPLLKEVLSAMGIRIYEKPGFEADDILGTLSARAEAAGIIPVVISGDRDMLQLASDTLKIKIPKTKAWGTQVEEYYAADVLEKYGVTPREFIDMKALMGDASDNVPGVPGIGEKTAAKIIAEYKSLEAAIERADEIKPKKASENLRTYRDQAFLSRELVTICRDMDIEFVPENLEIKDIFNSKSFELFRRLGFKSFLERFESADGGASREKYRKITDLKEYGEFMKTLVPGAETAYVIIRDMENARLCFYNSKSGAVYIEKSTGLDMETIFRGAEEFFSRAEYKKIAHDAKSDIKTLRGYGIELSPVVFDTAIAGYVLDSTKENYEYNDLASEYLKESLPSVDELLGRGKNRKKLFELSEEVRCSLAAAMARTAYCAKPIMEKMMEESDEIQLYNEIELPLIYVLADMEKHGIKVNRDEIIRYRSKLELGIALLEEDIYDMAGEKFNINSPKQLAAILFEKLGLRGVKKTKTGYSTAADVLEKLKPENEIIEKIIGYRQLTKLLNTYAVGLLAVMDENTERIYSTFNQTITATGRISSAEPNLQNIPIRLELGRELRKAFVPEEGFIFLDADYSQIELRVLAHMSGDETLINAFINGQDIHRLTASQVFNIPFEEVTPMQRNNAKAVNFGIIYGIGAFSLSEDLGVTRKEAERYISGYFRKYPEIKKFMDRTVREGEEKGYVSTMFGRRRAMPELLSGNFNVRSFGERAAMNMPIQGSAADIIKIAMIKVYDALKHAGLKSRLILQVHDELLVETYIPEREAVEKILKENMENAVKLKCPLIAEVHGGVSWYDAK